MQVTFNRTKSKQITPRLPKPGKPSQRPAAWRPQPSSLSRDELRRIVLEMIG